MINRKEVLEGVKRIVIKIGSSSLSHKETGRLDLIKLEVLVRQITDLTNMGKEVILVSSGAIMAGRVAIGLDHRPDSLAVKQACAAVGQGRLMMIYQKLFSEYNQVAAQVLITKYTLSNPVSRNNAHNTFEELMKMGVVAVVNENDTVATDEIEFGDNDTLSSEVAKLVGADLLILLSDIDGVYTDDPHSNPEAKFIDIVENIDGKIKEMAKGTTGTDVGTGGMATKVKAAEIATTSGVNMIIANGEDFHIIGKIARGEEYGTLFLRREQ